MFGGMCPLGLCAVAAAPGPALPVRCRRGGAGLCAVAAYRRGCAPILWRRPCCAFWRVFARAEDNAGQITAAAVGAVAFCTVRMAAALAGGEGLVAIALAAAQGMLIVGLGAALGACARWVRTAQSYARRSARPCASCIWPWWCAVPPIHF